MNHTVPEWDSAGRDLDAIWNSSGSASPSKTRWEGRRSDLAFVPDHSPFEELCYEDGQLLVMQCFGSKGNIKNRNYSAHFTPVDVPSAQSGLPVACLDGTFESLNSSHSVYSSTMNFNASQDDELLSWIRFSFDEQEVLNGGQTVTTPGERLCSSSITNHASQRNVEESVMPTTILQKTASNDGDTCINESGSSRDSIGKQMSKAQLEANTTAIRMEMPSTQVHLAMMGTSTGIGSSMNFANFARPAATVKASLHSIGIASGPSGAERLKQLDRVGADVLKMESIESLRKHLPSITEKVPSQIVPVAPEDASVSSAQNGADYSPSSNTTKQDTPGNGNSEVMGKSNHSNSSIITSTCPRTMQNTDVVEVVEPSDSFSSYGSEDINANEKRASGRRKSCDEDPEIQSKALESESTIKKHTTGIEDDMLKRRRIAESHNQSERRRRDRISEKMKALQSLIPNSHKTDKASMLEEAIVYIKTLKAQVQMMSSAGFFVSPMLLPQGMHHLQMTAWPPVAMDLSGNMGMVGMPGVNTGVSAGNSSAGRQFPPLLPMPCGGIPPIHTAPQVHIDLTHAAHPVIKPAVMSPVYQMVVPAAPAACDTVPVPNPMATKGFHALRKPQQPVQVLHPGIYGNGLTPTHQYPCPTTFITCGGVMQK